MSKVVYTFALTQEKIIEKIIADERVQINHVILEAGEALPVHNANAHVYHIITNGTMRLSLDDQEMVLHPAGTMLSISKGSKMAIENGGSTNLEFFIIKAPAPES